MYDPLYLILKSLNMLIRRITRIFALIFLNYFPDPTPDETDGNKF
jgi:hypothetical protein